MIYLFGAFLMNFEVDKVLQYQREYIRTEHRSLGPVCWLASPGCAGGATTTIR